MKPTSALNQLAQQYGTEIVSVLEHLFLYTVVNVPVYQQST